MEKLIIYDGYCVLCNTWVRRILRNDKSKLLFVTPLNSQTATSRLADVHVKKKLPDSILFIDNNKLYTKSSAALRIAKYMDRPWPVLYYSLIWIPFFIRDLIYDFIAKVRYRWFGKHESCPVLPKELRDRVV